MKSPKVYIRDSGITNYLLGVTSYEELLRHPMLGNLWEGYVIEEVINTLKDDYQYFFYRTADGAECDLVVFKGNQCLAGFDGQFSPSPKDKIHGHYHAGFKGQKCLLCFSRMPRNLFNKWKSVCNICMENC